MYEQIYCEEQVECNGVEDWKITLYAVSLIDVAISGGHDGLSGGLALRPYFLSAGILDSYLSMKGHYYLIRPENV